MSTGDGEKKEGVNERKWVSTKSERAERAESACDRERRSSDERAH